MHHSKEQSNRLNRLYKRLKKLGYMYWGACDGVGMEQIVTATAREPIQDSEFWVDDYIKGELTASHIITAMKKQITPYEARTASEKRKQNRSDKKRREMIAKASRHVELVEALSDESDDLDFATIDMAEVLIAASRKYASTCFELKVIGCPEYPFKATAADVPTIRVQVFNGQVVDADGAEIPD